jgi:hypothetical protein
MLQAGMMRSPWLHTGNRWTVRRYLNEIADRVPVSIDIYHNDISNTADNCIELMGARNIRGLRNAVSIQLAVPSSQPIFGGPNYIYQNVV